MPNTTNIIAPRVPFLDERTGLISREWYRFLFNQFELTSSTTATARRYGAFYDTTTQTAAAINTAYAVRFNSTELSNGVSIGTPSSRIYLDRSGVYDFQFSAQVDNTTNAVGNLYMWARVNGVDKANSASWVAIRDRTAQIIAAWNFVYEFTAGDYFELMWSVDKTTVQLLATPAAPPVPAIPSVILTVTDNTSG